jgi:hypothetical protein
MKAKTIKAVIRKKIDGWLSSIDDGALRESASKNVIVTGGCIASMLLREKVNDFDIYLRNKTVARGLAEYYVAKFLETRGKTSGIKVPISVEELDNRIKIIVKSAGIAHVDGATPDYQYFEGDNDPEATAAAAYVGEVMTDAGDIEDRYESTEQGALATETAPPYKPVFLSTNAITLSNKIQIIIRFFGEPDDIHENYDFVHCTNYWQSWDGVLELRRNALEALLTKELRYVGSKYPLCSIIRIRKFVNRGWTINAGQILKMCMQLNDLDLNDIAVLEDQLTGVDVAYFNEILNKLKAKDTERVESAYLLEIVERMF